MAMGVEHHGQRSRASFEMPFEEAELISLKRFSGRQDRVGGGSLASSAVAPLPLGRKSRDGEYLKWVEEHPHAVRSFDKLLARMQGKRVAIFLDYDGTLTPIVSNPDAAFISENMRETVRELADLFPTAIVSGRGREKVQDFVALDELYYAGSHGLDISAPENLHGKTSFGTLEGYQPAAEFVSTINVVHKELCDIVGSFPGSMVEHNKFCLSVHFRNCSPDFWEDLGNAVRGIVAKYETSLKLTHGRKVLEVRPRVDWDKGRAVEHLLKSLDLDKDDVLPIYLGDDRTDEDAFQALKERKRGKGIGILVSSKIKTTHAQFTLEDPIDVEVFLMKLAAWGQSQGNAWRKES